jgi:hypothetical protein
MKNLRILLLAPLLMAFQCDEETDLIEDELLDTGLLGRWEIADESIDGISDLSAKCCRFFEFSMDNDPDDLDGFFLYEDGTGTGFYEGVFSVDLNGQTIIFERDGRAPVTYSYSLSEDRDYLTFTFTENQAEFVQGWQRIY